MPETRRVTRTVTMSARALALGIFTLPEGVSYLTVGGGAQGEFPHAADPEGCDAALNITLQGSVLGRDRIDAWCTREEEHPPPHVAHLNRGMPLAAWTDEEPTNGDAT